jgi:small conductance mechanosensitive channel
LILLFTFGTIFTIWNASRYLVVTALSASREIILLLDATVIFGVGIVVLIFLSRSLSHYATSTWGQTQSNTVRLLFQIFGFSIVILITLSILGVNLVSALVGVGFIGIVVGLAAQAVLGNLFSGLMLLASRPFKIGDRIHIPSNIASQPFYTGFVQEITLMHTKILTESDVPITIPNSIVAQSPILNFTRNNFSLIEIQFQIPIEIDPEEFHRTLKQKLSNFKAFKGEEKNYEILAISPSTCDVVIAYQVKKNEDRMMKSLLLQAIRSMLSSHK